jgi:hypothetical protein
VDLWDDDDDQSANIEKFRRARKVSKELLESVKLRPVYRSFPRNGQLSPGAFLSTPRLNYHSIDHSPPIYPVSLPSPDSMNDYFGSIKKLSTFGATITSINYFIGVRLRCIFFVS